MTDTDISNNELQQVCVSNNMLHSSMYSTSLKLYNGIGVDYYMILAVSPRHACGRKGGDLNKKSIHEIGAPYVTPNFIIRRTAVLTIGVQCTFCTKTAPMVIS